MTKKRTLLAAALMATLALSACGGASDGAGASADTEAAAAADEASSAVATAVSESATSGTEATSTASVENAADHAAAADYQWDAADEVALELAEAGSTSDSDAVVVDGSTVTINTAGTYRLTGTLSDGQLVVDADDQTVRLVLDGVDITNTDGAAIAVMDAEKVIVVLADGTTNTLVDGAAYVFPSADTDEPNATLYSKADLTITGDGALLVKGNYNDGIGAKDGLVIDAGSITVDAVDDGIRGKDYIVVDGGTITVTAGGDAMKADNEDDAALGYIEINDGTIDLTAGGDGMSAETDVLVAAGSVAVRTAGGSTSPIGEDLSAKGIKGLVSVIIDGGSLTIDAADDAVHSNDTIEINGGELLLASGDDGVHADTSLLVAGGTITVTDSYEGLESALITIDAGSIEIYSDDDGINVAGGVDGSGFGGRPGRGGEDRFAVNSDYQLHINGGTIVLYAQGDGLDSNGIAIMTGGIAIVHGPTANNNGAIDAGSFDISGGTLVAVGSAGMAEGVDATSTQAAIEALLGTTQPAGTVLHIETEAGEAVLTFEPVKEFASIVFSSPDLEVGTSYDVYLGGSATGDAVGGMYDPSAYAAGTLAGSLAAG